MENRRNYQYCLIGNPVKHSFSPLIHNSITELMGLSGEYGLNQVETDLSGEIKRLHSEKINGINITVPYKSDVMECLVSIDDIARAIGAVNTLKWTEEGYIGYNTDYRGLSREISEEGIVLKGENVLLIGAGGAARAAAFLSALDGAKTITILNRTKDKAQIICDDLKKYFGDKTPLLRVCGYDELEVLKGQKYIAFQCTKIGMHPDVDNCIINDKVFYSLLKAGIDLIYTPSDTMFMINCHSCGVKAYNGLKMLLYQAVEAYEMWRDVTVPQAVINEVYNRLRNKTKHSIVLVGCMGAGKSCVGKAIAKKYEIDFVDTDQLIEKKEGCKISMIFEEKGETYFRELEHNCIKELSESGRTMVISVGGGLPVREDNRDYLKKAGVVLYLKAKADTLAGRLVNDKDRPLLKAGKSAEHIQALLDKRGSIYESVADYIIETDNLNINEIVDKGGRLV